MTRFNPDADLVPIEQWEQIAEQKALETGASWRILGGIIAGGVGFALSLEILGIVAGGYLCYSAYERIRRSGKDLKAVRDFGCVAHVLDEQDFRSFAKQFGDKEVYDQISFAIDRKWDVSKFALNWFNAYEGRQQLRPGQQDSRSIAPSPMQEGRQLQRSRDTSELAQHRPLHAPSFSTQVSTYNPSAESNINIVGEMTDRIRNIFGVGQGGSGKGMLLANALRAVKEKHSIKIFLINGKDDPKEYGYFADVVDIEKRLHCETAKPSTVAAWFEASVAEYDDYATQNNGALLVIDEGTIIGARLKDAKSNALNDKIIGITSCGGSNSKFIWIFAQTPFSGGNGSNQSAISQMEKVVLVKGDAIGVLDEWKYARMFRKFNPDDVADLADNSECNRAVYWSGTAKWYSMPKLINYSAYDRDSGTFIKDLPPSVEQLENAFTISEPTTIQDDILLEDKPQADDDMYKDGILDILQSSDNAMSLNAIRTSRFWDKKGINRPSRSLVKDFVYELLNEGLVNGNEGVGFFFTNNN